MYVAKIGNIHILSSARFLLNYIVYDRKRLVQQRYAFAEQHQQFHIQICFHSILQSLFYK